MNPITMLKLYRRAGRLLDLFRDATTSYERTHAVSKSLFASKTFWFNVLSASAELLQVVSGARLIPAEQLAIVTAIVNIGLRFVTADPVHVTEPK